MGQGPGCGRGGSAGGRGGLGYGGGFSIAMPSPGLPHPAQHPIERAAGIARAPELPVAGLHAASFPSANLDLSPGPRGTLMDRHKSRDAAAAYQHLSAIVPPSAMIPTLHGGPQGV
jgi:hypothetical protein